MEYTIHAMPTRYKDVLYRSKLEAKWAATFDLLGIEYKYEPFATKGWCPDFLLTRKNLHEDLEGGVDRYLAEVKPVDISTIGYLNQYPDMVDLHCPYFEKAFRYLLPTYFEGKKWNWQYRGLLIGTTNVALLIDTYGQNNGAYFKRFEFDNKIIAEAKRLI